MSEITRADGDFMKVKDLRAFLDTLDGDSDIYCVVGDDLHHLDRVERNPHGSVDFIIGSKPLD